MKELNLWLRLRAIERMKHRISAAHPSAALLLSVREHNDFNNHISCQTAHAYDTARAVEKIAKILEQKK